MEYLYLLPIVFMIHEFEEIIMDQSENPVGMLNRISPKTAQSETLGDCVKILIFAS